MYQIIEVTGMPKRLYHKIWLIMRLTTVILIACLMQVSAAGLAQKITLNQRDVPLSNVLKEIRKQSGFDVFSEGKGLPKNQKVTVVVTNASIEEALDQAFRGLGYTYKIDGKTIAIKPKEQPSFFERIIERFQAIDVTGRIVDETGQFISGATIKVKGTNVTTSSNEKGGFFLKDVDENATLEILFLGYQLKEVKASKDLGIIKMEIAVGKLEEVTVNAGYYKVNEREATGSISRITSKDIETQPVTNVLATMQGRMAGVDIIQDGGTPGGGFQIKIRGQNSLRADGNDPLYIIDGVPYSAETIGSSNTSVATASQTSPLNNINTADIESIEVLKDGDATAIYGSRGANGIVLITTKKGKAGKTSPTILASSGIGRVTKVMGLLNTDQYLEMRRQAFTNDGITYGPADYDLNGTWDQSRYTDWQKELTGGTAKINNFQASISGGSASTQYLISGTYRNETTVLPGDFEYEKGGAHFNMNHLSDDKKFRLIFSGNYTNQNNRQVASDLTRISRYLAPNAPALYDKDGNLNWENGTFENPLASLNGKFTSKTNDLVTNAVLSYAIVDGLELKTNLGFTDLKHDERQILPSTIYNPAYGIGSESSSLLTNLTLRQSWIVEPQLNWNKTYGDGKLEILLGGTWQQQRSSRLYQMGFGFSSNSLINDLTSATDIYTFTSDKTVYKYQAFFARANYNLQGKYIINLTGRRDGSSRFGPGKQFAWFGALGGAWLFSKEKFLKNIGILSFGKLRASYGVSGNDQIGDYQFLNTYASSATQYQYQGITGLNPIRLFNPDFGWETNRKFEAALETGFFKDRLMLTTAWYRNRSSNQLVGVPLPGTTGFSSLNANLDATVQNSGFEVTLRTLNLTKKSFNWSTNFNVSVSRNKLTSFPGLAGSTYSTRYIVGQSLNITKLYKFTGLNAGTGIYEFADINGDGNITAAKDKETIADLMPNFFGGLQNNFQYKGWQLDFLFQFVKQKNYDYISYVQGGSMNNQRADMINSWRNPSDRTRYQKPTTGTDGDAMVSYYNYTSSDAVIVDGSYIRLKNLSLTYNLSSVMPKGIYCKLSLTGQNLLTFTPYKGGDPEFRFSGFLPPLKVYTAGFQLTF